MKDLISNIKIDIEPISRKKYCIELGKIEKSFLRWKMQKLIILRDSQNQPTRLVKFDVPIESAKLSTNYY